MSGAGQKGGQGGGQVGGDGGPDDDPERAAASVADAARALLAHPDGREKVRQALAVLEPGFDVDAAHEDDLLVRAMAVIRTVRTQSPADGSGDPRRLLSALSLMKSLEDGIVAQLLDNANALADLRALGAAQTPPIDVDALSAERKGAFLRAVYEAVHAGESRRGETP